MNNGNKCPLVAIQDFAEVITGGTPSTAVNEYWENGTIPWLNSGELNNNHVINSSNHITETGLKNSNAKMMPPETVLIALTGATTGVTSFLNIDACANQSVTGILPSDNHDSKYLYFYLRSLRQKIIDESWGGAQKHISQGYVKKINVPLPPLDEQRRIATILDKADAIRRKRQEAIRLTDEFLRSVFLDMFGDPVTNPKGWDVNLLSDLGKLARGKSKHRPRNDPILLGGKYPLIQTGDVANANHFIKEYSQTYSEIGLQQSMMWPAKTLCITIAANIADTAILTFNACFPDSVVGFTPGKQVRSEYIHMWLTFYQKIIRDKAPESAQKNINLKILSELKVPRPPYELQSKFADIFYSIEDLKNKKRNNLDSTRILFSSLTQRAFKGDL